jgi:polynucleotide 5'-hydroxyl-kinase GRC3/NOL9
LLPDLLIALGGDPALEAICAGQATLQALRLPSSPEARRKTDGERRAARRKAFQSYFLGAATLRLERRLVHPMEADAPLPADLLVGLSDEEGIDLGLGLLKGADGETLEVLSPIEGSTVARVTPGVVRLDGNFAEVSARLEPQGSSPMPSA